MNVKLKPESSQLIRRNLGVRCFYETKNVITIIDMVHSYEIIVSQLPFIIIIIMFD